MEQFTWQQVAMFAIGMFSLVTVVVGFVGFMLDGIHINIGGKR